MLKNKNSLEKLSLYKDLSSKDAERICGGRVPVSVDSIGRIVTGRGRIWLDLRKVLKDSKFVGLWEDCIATINDFNGDLQIECAEMKDEDGNLVADDPDKYFL